MAASAYLLVLLSVVLYFLLTQVDNEIDPVATGWKQNLSKDGPFALNEELKNIKLLAKGKIHGPETVVFDENGDLFAFTENGAISKLNLKEGTISEWVNIGGRPLSGAFDANGDLVVVDPVKGLLKIKKDTKEIQILSVKTEDRKPIAYADDVSIAPDGKIYFSDASEIPPILKRNGNVDLMIPFFKEAFEGRKTGRLIEYDPETKKSRVLISNLYFANGVLVSKDGTFVLVNESFEKRVWRYWLKGEKAGTKEIFVDTLPAFLDGISQASNGNFWVAGIALDQKPGFNLFSQYPLIKGFLASFFIEILRKSSNPIGIVYEINQQGQVVRTLYDPKGETISEITSITEHEGKLYLGGFRDSIGVKIL